MALVSNPFTTQFAGLKASPANRSHLPRVGRALGDSGVLVPLPTSHLLPLIGYMSVQLPAEAVLSLPVGTAL